MDPHRVTTISTRRWRVDVIDCQLGNYNLSGTSQRLATLSKHFSRLIIDPVEYNFVIAEALARKIYVDRRDAFLSNVTRLGTIVT